MKLFISILYHRAPDADGVCQHNRLHIISEEEASGQHLFSAISNALWDDMRECEGGVIISHSITKL